VASHQYASISAFNARDDLKPYGDASFLLFALQLKLSIEDIQPVAVDAVVDGPHDMKCDLVYVDRDEKLAVVAQSYFSHRERESAPANKAADLNTAASWILAVDTDQLSDRIRSAAASLRAALRDGEIELIEFWYLHNLPESDNVAREMLAVEHSI
jgi:hypothetical protein